MATFLAKWGVELVLGIIGAAITGYLKWETNKLKKKLADADQFQIQQSEQKIKEAIDIRIKPIYEELENLRNYARDNAVKSEAMMQLIIDSYKYRLVSLCKEHLNEGYLTQTQFDQLSEFYKLYTGLGGNGQAQQYYERTIQLPIRK